MNEKISKSSANNNNSRQNKRKILKFARKILKSRRVKRLKNILRSLLFHSLCWATLGLYGYQVRFLCAIFSPPYILHKLLIKVVILLSIVRRYSDTIILALVGPIFLVGAYYVSLSPNYYGVHLLWTFIRLLCKII